MSITEALERLTHREFMVLMAHYEGEWNRPSRSDWYLMQIARQVACVLHKSPDKVKTDRFKLDFSPVRNVKKSPEKKSTTDRPKGTWAKLIGLAKK